MEKQFNPKQWVKSESYDIFSAFQMCDYIISQFYSNSSFACPQELYTHCVFLYSFVIFLEANAGAKLKTLTHNLWSLILEKMLAKISKKLPEKSLILNAEIQNLAYFLLTLKRDNHMCILREYKRKLLKK